MRDRKAKRAIATALLIVTSWGVSGAPMEWASDKQRDVASRLATALASTELCDVDTDPEHIAAVVQANFGNKLTAQQTADLMYQVVVLQAVQGAQVKGMTPDQVRDRCSAYRKLYGPNGSDLRGLFR